MSAEDELEVVAALSPEQVVERARSLLLEAEYWRHTLEDLREVGVGARDVTTAILTSTESALELAVLGHSAAIVPVGRIIAENRKALDVLVQVAAGLERLAALAEGRQKSLEPVGDALLRAAGVEPDGEPGSEAS